MPGNQRCGVRRRAAEHELDVGHRELRPRLDEGVQPARHHGAGSGAEEVGADHAARHAVETHLAVERAGALRAKHDQHGEMILQVLADRQVDDGLDTVLAQMRGRTDAGEHQQLRRVEGAAGDDHLARRPSTRRPCRRSLRPYSTPVARVPCISTRVACAPVSTVRFSRLRAGLQIGARSRRPAAVADGVLAAAEAFLLLAVVVVGAGSPRPWPASSQAS